MVVDGPSLSSRYRAHTMRTKLHESVIIFLVCGLFAQLVKDLSVCAWLYQLFKKKIMSQSSSALLGATVFFFLRLKADKLPNLTSLAPIWNQYLCSYLLQIFFFLILISLTYFGPAEGSTDSKPSKCHLAPPHKFAKLKRTGRTPCHYQQPRRRRDVCSL